jgi:hypothetical protein
VGFAGSGVDGGEVVVGEGIEIGVEVGVVVRRVMVLPGGHEVPLFVVGSAVQVR